MTATSMSISSGVKSTVGELTKLSLINLKAPEIENSVLKQSYSFRHCYHHLWSHELITWSTFLVSILQVKCGLLLNQFPKTKLIFFIPNMTVLLSNECVFKMMETPVSRLISLCRTAPANPHWQIKFFILFNSSWLTEST